MAPYGRREIARRNRASDTLDLCCELVNARDYEGLREVVSDAMARDDRRRTIAAPPSTGADAFISTVTAWFDVGFEEFRIEALDWRDDHLVLTRSTWLAANDAEVSFLALYEVDAQGRLARGANFDPDDLAVATRELAPDVSS